MAGPPLEAGVGIVAGILVYFYLFDSLGIIPSFIAAVVTFVVVWPATTVLT